MKLDKLEVFKNSKNEEVKARVSYPRYKYQNPRQYPICIYIPSDIVLIQLMRMCCYVEKVKDFVFNLK